MAVETIRIILELDDEFSINGEYTGNGPLEMDWFPRNDLILETGGKKVVVNTDNTTAGGVYKITKEIF